MSIEKLIKKYYKPEGKNKTGHLYIYAAERTSNKYKRKVRQESMRKHRHLLLDELLLEIPFNLTDSQITQIRYWIDNFNPYWKQFHRQVSNETIILAMIMIQRKKVNSKLQVEKFSISRKYGLTSPIFTNIQNSLIFLLMQTTQLVYNQKAYYNNEILSKEGHR